jgi:hypothetical protein
MDKNKLSSIQRRLIKEEDELELDIPEKPTDEEPTDEAPDDELELDVDDEEPSPAPEAGPDETEESEKMQLLTQAIDDLEQMRSSLNKKGLLVAMHMSDFSTQRRLQSMSDELGPIIAHLNDKMLKMVSQSPAEVDQATQWLSGEER